MSDSTEPSRESEPLAKAQKLGPYRWKKGQSGNPKGRTPGFGRYIRERTGESGEKLFAIAWKIARGHLSVEQYVISKHGEAIPVDVGPTVRERLDAVKFLAEHGFGRPQASLNVTGTVQHLARHDLSRLSEEDMSKLDAIVNQIELDDGADVVEGELVPELPAGDPAP